MRKRRNALRKTVAEQSVEYDFPTAGEDPSEVATESALMN
jgi:hypothetical protein